MHSKNNAQFQQASYSKVPPSTAVLLNNETHRTNRDNSPVQKDISDMSGSTGPFVSNNISKEKSQQPPMMLPNLRDLLNESAPPSAHVAETLYPRVQYQQSQPQNGGNFNSRNLHSYYSNTNNNMSSNPMHQQQYPNLGFDKIPAHIQSNSSQQNPLFETSHARYSPPHPQQHVYSTQPPHTIQPSPLQQQHVSRLSPPHDPHPLQPITHQQHLNQSSPPPQQQPMTQQQHINPQVIANRTIQDLERELDYQSRFIVELERQNSELRRELMHVRQQQQQQHVPSQTSSNGSSIVPAGTARMMPIRTKNDPFETANKKRNFADVQPTTVGGSAVTTYLTSSVNDSKKRKTSASSPSASSASNILDSNNNKEISIVDESVDKLNTANMHKYIVKWKGETYVLVSIFKNRTQILNYYVPLYQSQNPDKVCKIVLSNEDYKQLSNENPDTVEKKKHAWRVSVFSLDFYNFVKNFQKKNHQQKASSFIPFDATTQINK
ncbi:predicted protein [Naegleria gruberi]|uniref:Predicted protein n=1 Tax=Naegleria gruberi TaxID=5762 RepID=D2VG32_NAEGR|nr:uncharacterized protein NAEGRDRAFT_79841 [Naegleria gruberi]EFC44197.1 predicted protein [Naegleria gruberi]|eukprot:XP_002676941.1 predicted protein [Naegleria gruberi strain NEG-M]